MGTNSHPPDFEYAIISTLGDLGDEKSFASFSPDQRDDALETAFSPPTKAIAHLAANLNGGGWEVLSHSVFAFGGQAIVTFLIRRKWSQ